jgi:hypothetical protein
MSIFEGLRRSRTAERPVDRSVEPERAQAPVAGQPASFASDPEGVPLNRRRRRESAGRPAEGARRRALWGPRQVGAAAVGTVGWGVLAIARLIMAIATLIALLIALAIVLRDVDANAHNTIVKGIHDGANFFAGAFTGLITFKGHAKREITVDWGIALLVYLIVGSIIARWIGGIGRSGLTYGRTRGLAS